MGMQLIMYILIHAQMVITTTQEANEWIPETSNTIALGIVLKLRN